MAVGKTKRIFPVWGYVVLNLVVLAFLFVVYHVAMQVAEAGKWDLFGFFPVLAVCYLAFLFVSIYDAVYDRFSKKPGQKPGGEPHGTSDPS